MAGCLVETVCGRELGLGEHVAEDSGVSGVFPHLVNHAAFIDKLILGVRGRLRKRIGPVITTTANLPIGGPGRPYARSMHGIYKTTGNPFELKYGRNPAYPNLFRTKLILRSEAMPISYAEVNDILMCLFWRGQWSRVQGLESTLDVSVPFRFFANHLITRAHSVRTLTDGCNRQTLYAGAPGAPWMVRIYQKTHAVTRVEFVLRHTFLAKVGIVDLGSLGNLKTVQYNRLVRFPSVCQRALEDLIAGKATGKQLQLILEWPNRRPTRILLDVLSDYGLEGDQILRGSPVGQLLQKMQESFQW